MNPALKQKLITGGVVFGGLIAIAVAKKLGADHDAIAAAVGALTVLAGSLRSMIVTENPK